MKKPKWHYEKSTGHHSATGFDLHEDAIALAIDFADENSAKKMCAILNDYEKQVQELRSDISAIYAASNGG